MQLLHWISLITSGAQQDTVFNNYECFPLRF